ncbi:hypothetical protein RhiirA1_511744 [Rhizophagus irregularis]|uniref:Uncharacterized protein n=3 Tax=Rhizophagus irregularis TaxID=588596 RepID=A0A2I1DRZ3_9GLOM|nr:hypothetical protein RhiirA1_511744 [Rhizophagus irregularis]PKY12609.1 hypothetical protein RhiirB3_508020 [Rhizophagus irregularis]
MAEFTLFCYVLGTPVKSAIPIDIGNITKVDGPDVSLKKLNFGHIKKLIWPNDNKANQLKLMKFVTPLKEDNEELKELNKKFYENIELSDKLSPCTKVLKEFPAGYEFLDDYIHIIVQPPPPVTTATKRQLDSDYWDEVRYRKKRKLRVPETILTRALKTMEDIMKISDDPRVYSNPENLLPLPFPFLGERKPVERFSIKNKRFLYMGRKAFDNVLNTINEFKYEEGYMDCFIYGTIGYGKSHILATIVCFLLRTGKRVVYLPDCRELARDPEYYIKSALFLTYANDSAKMSEIHSCVTLDEIEEFCKEESEPLYIVVDQMNALDGHNNTEIDETTKQRIVGFLGRIATKHYYIKSSSANNISALHLKLKQTNEKKIELYEGFDKDEMLQWWIRNNSNLPSMDEERKRKIEYITGRNPLFLSFLPGQFGNIHKSNWIQCIKKFKNNPSVKGFMVEKACLASIYKNGLMAKEIDFSMNEGLCTFYLPRLWNQKSIDGLITLYKMKNKKEKVEENTLYIAPIQITLDKETHSDSEASFFSGIWPELESKILGGLKVEVIFIWITRENDVDYFVEANKKILKQRTIEINPQYTLSLRIFYLVFSFIKVVYRKGCLFRNNNS